MDIGIGILGAGQIGLLHAQTATKAGLSITSVFDVDQDKAHALAEQFGDARVCESLNSFAADASTQAVVIATPNVLHHDHAIECLRSEKDVLLEKPMAVTVEQCDSILRILTETDRILQVGFVCRHSPTAVKARQFVESGALGTIYHAKANLYRRRGIPGLGRWFTTKAQSGGGVLIDLGVHLIDIVLHVTGQPTVTNVAASCTSTFGSPIADYAYDDMWAGPPNPDGVFDVEDGVTALLRCSNRLSIEINTTWASNVPDGLFKDGVLLLGDKGGCFFDLWGKHITLTSQMDAPPTDQEILLSEGNAWEEAWLAQHAAFAESIRSRTQPSADAHAGRYVQRIVEAIYESSEAGQDVLLESE